MYTYNEVPQIKPHFGSNEQCRMCTVVTVSIVNI